MVYYLIRFIVQGEEVLKEEGTMYVDSKVLKADTASRMNEDRNPRARRLRVEVHASLRRFNSTRLGSTRIHIVKLHKWWRLTIVTILRLRFCRSR